jgi:predicted lactoylglutathione lyase
VAFALALPIADRRTAYDFYRSALHLTAIGRLAEDGVPEPLQFALAPGANLVLVPTEGFGWVTAGHEVVGPGQSECVLTHVVSTPAEVDTVTERARAAGATVVVEPADPGWGYSSTFTDPDGHLWMVETDSGPLGPPES